MYTLKPIVQNFIPRNASKVRLGFVISRVLQKGVYNEVVSTDNFLECIKLKIEKCHNASDN